MTLLGKPLVFRLKYMNEMYHLYGDPEEGKEPDLIGLDDAERVQEMARAVGAVADEQAADFLELCGKAIEDHFASLKVVTLAKKKTRKFIKNNWSWNAEFHVSSVPGGSFWCGVWLSAPTDVNIALPRDVCGVVVPWLWSSGVKGEGAIWKVIGNWAQSRAGEGLSDEKGTVDLACIPIKAQPPERFDVDQAPLIDEVTKTIARIGVKETKAIAKNIAGL